MEIPSISAAELAAELAAGRPVRLLDVREPFELEISRLPGSLLVPMAELPARLGELDPEADWVVVCRTGNRSGRATAWLIGQGWARVRNLTGGLNAWSREVDPSMTQY